MIRSGTPAACQGIEPSTRIPTGNITTEATRAQAGEHHFLHRNPGRWQGREQAVLDLAGPGKLDDERQCGALNRGQGAGEGDDSGKDEEGVAGASEAEIGEDAPEDEQQEQWLHDNVREEDGKILGCHVDVAPQYCEERLRRVEPAGGSTFDGVGPEIHRKDLPVSPMKTSSRLGVAIFRSVSDASSSPTRRATGASRVVASPVR